MQKLRAHPTEVRGQSGINMVDLMMWLVIAALMLAAAIQGIGYYQQAAYAYQAKSDLSGGHTWAASKTSLTSKVPTIEELQEALDNDDYSISNDNDLALIAVSGQKYCMGIKAGNVNSNNVFYSSSDDPANIQRGPKMPESCGSPGEAGGPGAPPADSDNDGTPNISDDDLDNDGTPNTSDPDIDNDGIINENDPDIDGDRVPNATDDTPNGYSNDTDTDSDGISDSTDPDIDGDGKFNFADNDIDGDSSLNPGDTTAYGDGSYTGPSLDMVIAPAGGSALVDPYVSIESASYDPNTYDVNFKLNIQSEQGGMIGRIYHFTYRITCALPDSSQFYKYGMVETSYKSGSPKTVTFKGSCPQTGGITTAVGYVGGGYNGHPALITSSSYKGPTNMVTGGVVFPLKHHDASMEAFGSTSDPRVFLRNVRIKSESIDVGMALEVGAASQSGNIYGFSYRITCQHPDGSQFYKHGNLTTSYKQDTYPALVFNVACPTGAIARGYVVGPDSSDPALSDPTGYKGPVNVMKGGVVAPLEGLTPSTTAASQTYSNPRVSLRTLTYSGNTANVGINLNTGGTGGSGTIYSFSYRLTCKAPGGAITYKKGVVEPNYNNSTHPGPTFSVYCNTGDEVVGAVAGPYMAHAGLTSGSSWRGPVNYAVVGQQ